MKLEDIGFYTLCNKRCENLSPTSPMWRCEMILTDRCNFRCPYCRGLRPDCKGDMPLGRALNTLDQWCADGLKHVRFSGGEPLVYPHLPMLVRAAEQWGVERIAISSNGSFPLYRYLELIEKGVNDFSISLDACCASFGDEMAGVSGCWRQVVSNIRVLSKHTYVTVGVVLTDTNAGQVCDIVKFAHDCGVADIRIIPAAQAGNMIEGVQGIPQEILDAHPILKYRVNNILAGRPVRGIDAYDSHRCYLAIDDSVVCGNYHFPCVIQMREHGQPIGEIGPNMRAERIAWAETHDTHADPICQRNCLDVCCDHNNYVGCIRKEGHR